MPTARPRIIVATPHAAEFHELADCLSANTFEPVRSMTAKAACEEITSTGAAMLVADAIFAFQQGVHAAWRARYPQLSAIVRSGRRTPVRSEPPRGCGRSISRAPWIPTRCSVWSRWRSSKAVQCGVHRESR